MNYVYLKYAHMGLVLLSLLLLNWRFFMRMSSPNYGLPKWSRVLPHVNDTLLLLTGLALIHLTRYLPFVNAPWLGVKLILLVLYVVLGYRALKATPRSHQALALWFAAMLTIASMAYLALFKPLLW